MAFGIIDILQHYGFDPKTRAKLVRHQDSGKYDVHELRRSGHFETYQAFQVSARFKGCTHIISFLGDGRTRARFFGVYRVLGLMPAREFELPAQFPYPEWAESEGVYYDLELEKNFDTLRDRVVIEWGASTRAWLQKLTNKEVIELSPPGRIAESFDDYHEFSLRHDELQQIVKNADANREWRARLSAVSGIYLISGYNGQQYIGSAYGAEGIWGRWQAYAKNGHGGNKLLRQLVESESGCPKSFRYSVLHVLPVSTTRHEVLRWEGIYKEKLGTRATGLNLN